MMTRYVLGLMMVASLAACSPNWVKPGPGADRVQVRAAGELSACQSRGSIDVSALDHVWFYHRSQAAIDANLLQLARNGAVSAGANTVVAGARRAPGERDFLLYQCAP